MTLRAELDACLFHLYGIERHDVARHGEYRTRRLVLERYDAMSQAIASGHPYHSPLDPPPCDPAAAHPGSRAR